MNGIQDYRPGQSGFDRIYQMCKECAGGHSDHIMYSSVHTKDNHVDARYNLRVSGNSVVCPFCAVSMVRLTFPGNGYSGRAIRLTLPTLLPRATGIADFENRLDRPTTNNRVPVLRIFATLSPRVTINGYSVRDILSCGDTVSCLYNGRECPSCGSRIKSGGALFNAGYSDGSHVKRSVLCSSCSNHIARHYVDLYSRVGDASKYLLDGATR